SPARVSLSPIPHANPEPAIPAAAVAPATTRPAVAPSAIAYASSSSTAIDTRTVKKPERPGTEDVQAETEARPSFPSAPPLPRHAPIRPVLNDPHEAPDKRSCE